MNMVKLYVDGLIQTRTALVIGNYSHPEPDLGLGDNGVHYFLQERISKYISALQVKRI